MNKFCEILKQVRVDKGLAQKQVADALNVSESGYAHWEQGRTEPNIEMLINLADFFDISLDELVGRE